MHGAATHEFFAATAGVAGALIGLLFVAVSVAGGRVIGPEAREAHAVRAAAALTAFTNALAVSLFALIPGVGEGGAPTSVAALGLLFIAGALRRVLPAVREGQVTLREVTFLLSLVIVFVIQLIAGISLDLHPDGEGALQAVCVLVAVCFFLGIERSWELVGGPEVSIFGSVSAQRTHERDAGDA
jgi:hypothetical protein